MKLVKAKDEGTKIMQSEQGEQPVNDRWLDVEEIRLISDLRIMHSKVDELYNIVSNLKRRHNEAIIHKYADQPVLSENISKVDEIYLWFVRLKEEEARHRQAIS